MELDCDPFWDILLMTKNSSIQLNNKSISKCIKSCYIILWNGIHDSKKYILRMLSWEYIKWSTSENDHHRIFRKWSTYEFMLKIKKECDPHVSFVKKVQRKVIHILFKHYKCKSCGKSFSQAGNLKKHFVHDGHKLEILSHTTVCFCKACEPLILEFSIFTCSICVIYYRYFN